MRGSKKLTTTLGLLAAVAVTLFALLNFRAIDDWLKLRNYQPSSEVAKLAGEDTMTEEARHIFYVNHPDLLQAANTFQDVCPTHEQTIVLGCYHSVQRGIFIYQVNDPRLNGVSEVTAAHEMLHGAYDRLSSNDRKQVDIWLNDYYQNDLHDQRIIDTINSYKKTEPNDVINEMHSVFGTEAGNLTPQLESYYQRYFSNRSAVVTFADGYENEFTSRINQINIYEQQLAELKQAINTQEATLSTKLAKIEADRRNLEGLRSSGRFAEYNAGVAAFNAEIDQYNSGVSQLKSDILAYNGLVEKHNALAAELRSLYSSLDTNLSAQTAQ